MGRASRIAMVVLCISLEERKIDPQYAVSVNFVDKAKPFDQFDIVNIDYSLNYG